MLSGRCGGWSGGKGEGRVGGIEDAYGGMLSRWIIMIE